jgi:hypothetical protein
MNQIIGELKKTIHLRTMIMLSISIIFGMVLWLLPLQKTIDIGGFDIPWVSEFYAPQKDAQMISYRWSHVQGQLFFMGIGDGDYTLRIVMRSVQPTSVQMTVDGVRISSVMVSNTFAEYMLPVQIQRHNAGTSVVTLQCAQPQIDGTRPACVAVDSVAMIPRAISTPPLWPLLGTMFLLLGIMLLTWEYLSDWRWVIASIAGIGAVFVLVPLWYLAVMPYLIVVLCALGVLRYSAHQPVTRYWQAVQLCMVAAIVTTVRFAFQGSVGLMLEDEGFLWYGSQRIFVGELPIRDFYAYEPFRYIWNALVMFMVGSKSIYALRIAIAVYEWMTLTIVCVILSFWQVRWQPIIWLLGIVTLLLWLYPRHKIYDHFVIWLMLLAFWWWIVNPTTRRTFWSGVVVGVAGMIGRNHGVYALFAGVLLLGYVWWTPMAWNQRFQLGITWSMGILAGFAPMLLLMIVIPSFGFAYIEDIRMMLTMGEINQSVPIPWPWDQSNWSDGIASLWFVIPTVLYVMTLSVLCVRRWYNKSIPVELLVSTIVGIVYLHVVYVRADISHLAQGITPFIVLVFLLVAYLPRWLQISIMVLLCMWSVNVNWKTVEQSTFLGSNANSQEVTVSDQLTVSNTVAKQLALLEAIQQKYNPMNEAFVVTPYWSGAYALWQQRSPLYNTYVLSIVDNKMQAHEIDAITNAKPRFILIDDRRIDNQKRRQFVVYYALVDAYIRTNFQLVKDPLIPENMRLYVPKP